MKFEASDLGVELIARPYGDAIYLQASRTHVVDVGEGVRHAHVVHVRRPLAEVEKRSGMRIDVEEIDPDALIVLLTMLAPAELAEFIEPGSSSSPDVMAEARAFLAHASAPATGASPDDAIAHTQSGHGFADEQPGDAPIPEPPLPTIEDIEATGRDRESAMRIYSRQLAIVGAWRAGARTHRTLREAMDAIDDAEHAEAARDAKTPPPPDNGDRGDVDEQRASPPLRPPPLSRGAPHMFDGAGYGPPKKKKKKKKG